MHSDPPPSINTDSKIAKKDSIDELSSPSALDYKDLHVMKKIGKSIFPVYLVNSKICTGTHYVMKVFPYKDQQINRRFIQEALFRDLSHPNIIAMLDYVEKKKAFGNKKPMDISYVLMEYAPHGDFAKIIANKLLPKTDQLVRTYFHQLISAVEYLHEKNVAHMDLKLDNLLVGDEYQLKIIDFDHAIRIQDNKLMTFDQGVEGYRAPEMINQKQKQESLSTRNPKAVDIYALGIILFIFKLGFMPYSEDRHQSCQLQLFRLLIVGESDDFWDLWEGMNSDICLLDPEFKQLFIGMTNPDPVQRFTLEQIKENKWFRGQIYSDTSLATIMNKKLSSHQ